MNEKRVAIVHDWLYGGGAEKVVQELHALYPDAPIYTSYCTDEWRERLDNTVVTGYLQRWPFRSLRKFLPLLRQWWFASLDLSAYDVVISSSGNGEAKFVRVREGAEHICYCHTPTHFYWRQYEQYASNPGFRPYWLARLGLRLLVKPLRQRDYQAAQRVDRFIANSQHIQADIKQFYKRDSVVIHPPVAVERFQSVEAGERRGYITVGRQTPYKRVDLIIEACNQLGLPLTIVGNGPEHVRLQKRAGPSVTLRSDVDDDELPTLLARAEGFIFAAHEDFGIAPVEAMAAGTPVIAYQAGGALDYVEPGKTGLLFAEQTVASLVSVLEHFQDTSWQHDEIAASADKFSASEFRQAFRNNVQEN